MDEFGDPIYQNDELSLLDKIVAIKKVMLAERSKVGEQANEPFIYEQK